MSRSTGKVPSWASNAQTGIGVADIFTGLAGARDQAQATLDYGRDTLLTARSNINQRKLEAQQSQFQILESGHQAASIVQREATRAEGAVRATAGGSGAVLDGGTPQAVLTNIAQEGLNAQRDVILNSRNQMKALRRDVNNRNKSEWKDAEKVKEQSRKDAKQIIGNARIQAGIKIAKMAVDAATAGATAGVPTPDGSTASNVAAGMSVASDVSNIQQNSRYQRGAKDPRNIKIPSRTHNPNRRQGSRYQFGVTQGSRKASGVGSFNQPLGSGQMQVKGWRWKKGNLIRPGVGHRWKLRQFNPSLQTQYGN